MLEDSLKSCQAAGKAVAVRLLQRLLAACEQMQQGGWWEEPKADIKMKLGFEIGAAVFKNVLGLTG